MQKIKFQKKRLSNEIIENCKRRFGVRSPRSGKNKIDKPKWNDFANQIQLKKNSC